MSASRRLLCLLAALLPALTNAAETIESRRVVWTFGGRENWTVWWPAERGERCFKLRKDAKAAYLDIDANPNADVDLAYYEGALKGSVVMQQPIRFTTRVELLAGENVTLVPQLQDSTTEGLVFRGVVLEPGVNALSWEIPGDVVDSWSWGGARNRVVDGGLKLWQYQVRMPKGSPAARLKFTEAAVVERKATIDYLSVALATGHPINLVIAPGAKEQPELTISNAADKDVACRLGVRLRTWDGPLPAVEQELKVPAKGSVRVPLADPSPKQGIRWVDVTFTEGDYVVRKQASYAKLVPNPARPGRKDGFLFSICTHAIWAKPEDRRKEYTAMSLIGTKLVRDSFDWGHLANPKPEDGYRWQLMDEYVKLADEFNLELQGNIGCSPRWAAPEDKAASKNHLDWLFSAPVRGWDALATFTFDHVTRYKDKIRYWECGNEPDLEFFWRGNVDEYIRYLRTVYANAKKADPTAVVMTGGFSGIGPHAGKKLNPDMHERVLREAQDAFDVHAFHQHGVFDRFQRVVDVEMPKLLERTGCKKPIYYNETAMYSSSIGEAAQAELLYKKLLLTFSRGAIGYTWYDLRNDGEDPLEPEHNFGMLTRDYHPKAVYVAFNTLTTLLGDQRHTGDIALGNDTYVFGFGPNPGAAQGSYVVAGWVEKTSEPDRLAAFRVGPGATAAEVDLMGNATPLPVHDQIVLWNVTRACRFLAIAGAQAAPVFLGQPVVPPARTAAVPGKAAELACRLHNPLGRPVKLTCRWELPECLSARTALESELTLAAGGDATVALPVSVGRRPADAAHDQPVNAVLRYSLAGTPWAGAVNVPVLLKIVVAADALAAPQPLFRLAAEERVTNTFANDPSHSELAWRGPADLAASIWLGVERGDTLVVRVDVTDDVHQQPNKAGDMWKGDSIQFGFQAPGQGRQWELGLARSDKGQALVHTWMIPDKLADPTAAVTLDTQKIGGGLRYLAKLPLAAFGLTVEQLRAGLKFNLIVNDCDKGTREGWIWIAQGIGDRKDPGPWPEVLFE